MGVMEVTLLGKRYIGGQQVMLRVILESEEHLEDSSPSFHHRLSIRLQSLPQYC